VAWAEDFVYGVEDRVKRVAYHDAAPKTFWEEPPAAAAEPVPSPALASNADVAPPFTPAAFAPPVESVAAPGDGRWIPISDPRTPGDGRGMFKRRVPPDAKRSYAAVAVGAMALSRLGLSRVAGTVEPQSSTVARADRPGLVPADRFGDLVAAFNGGF